MEADLDSDTFITALLHVCLYHWKPSCLGGQPVARMTVCVSPAWGCPLVYRSVFRLLGQRLIRTFEAPSTWHYRRWLQINPPYVWGEVWNARASRSVSFLFSFPSFRGCRCRERINLEAVTRESNVISIRHQIMATTESWNGRSIIDCMDLLFSFCSFFFIRSTWQSLN